MLKSKDLSFYIEYYGICVASLQAACQGTGHEAEK
jgi:hypothetical protein